MRFNFLKKLFGGKTDNEQTPAPKVSARRLTTDSNTLSNRLDILITDLTYLSAKYPFEFHDILDGLFLFDPNFGKLLHIKVSLGNSGHELRIDAPSSLQARKALQVCNDLAARCFPHGGGYDGLSNVLFGQSCRSGGMACEWVPNSDLSRIERAFPFPVKTIRFRIDSSGNYILGQLQDNFEFVPLNTLQVSYHASRTVDGNPYPIPPALNALNSAVTNKQARENIAGWFRRLPMPGFASITFERPPIEIGESVDEYNTRCQKILDQQATAAADNFFNNGIFLGFDSTKTTFNNTTTAAPGAKQLLQAVEEDLFCGLKMDPILFGRAFNRTETWSKVAFEELISSIRNEQRGVKRVLEHGHRLNLALHGMGNIGVSVRFNPIRSLDQSRDSDASYKDSLKIQSEFDKGLISKEEARKALGYDKETAKAGDYVASFSRDTQQYELIQAPQSVFQVPSSFHAGPADIELLNSVASGAILKTAREYRFAVERVLTDAGRNGVKAVEAWARVNDVPDVETFVSYALQRFISGSEGSIDTDSLSRLTDDYLKRVYKAAKSDPDLWEKTPRGFGLSLGESDYQAIRYMSGVDRFYTSKYVSNSPVRNTQIESFLQYQYLERGLGRGWSKRDLDRFTDRFEDLTDRIGTHAARVIVDTGTSRAQNWSNVITLDENRITEFKFSGPKDTDTCDWCWNLVDRVFKTQIERSRIRRAIQSGSEDITQFDKFLRNRFDGEQGLERLKKATDVEVQESGSVAPPIHGSCRHRIVAVIKKAA